MNKVKWPDGKKFAFTVVDDTDLTTLDNGPAVYDLLDRLSIRTTKTVWIFNGEARIDNMDIIGDTCENPDYLQWVKSLQDKGFEIALHNVSWSSSRRERVIEGLELFEKYFGCYPSLLAQHNDSIENESLYWGSGRVSFPIILIYKFLTLFSKNSVNSTIYQGAINSSPYFWGDICHDRIKYVRNFIYSDINTLKSCNLMPYYDRNRTYVKAWFASTEAPDKNAFNSVVTPQNILRLESQGGCCIIYTHFGKGFVENGSVDSEFEKRMEYLAEQKGWFAPASEILDYLEEQNGGIQSIGYSDRLWYEIKWLIHKILVGGTT